MSEAVPLKRDYLAELPADIKERLTSEAGRLAYYAVSGVSDPHGPYVEFDQRRVIENILEPLMIGPANLLHTKLETLPVSQRIDFLKEFLVCQALLWRINERFHGDVREEITKWIYGTHTYPFKDTKRKQ